MYDLHYDLLTYIYMNKNNITEVREHCRKIFKDNITGGIFNLFYMSPKEMEEELLIKRDEINIIQNLKTINKLICENNLIPTDIKYIYGIEGLDYLEKIEDINQIYDLGVRCVNIVWNNDNKFAGGVKGDKARGLTDLGKELVKKLVDKKIAIDLSHSNEKTFYDIVELCDKLKTIGKNPIVFASHSNVKEICNHQRNLSDDQIKKIKELDGIIGIVGVKSFCIAEKNFDNNKEKYQKEYIKHIKYIRRILGGVDNIAVSTDDMTFYKTTYYKYFNVFKQENIRKQLETVLYQSQFNKEEVEKILYSNFNNKILEKL